MLLVSRVATGFHSALLEEVACRVGLSGAEDDPKEAVGDKADIKGGKLLAAALVASISTALA